MLSDSLTRAVDRRRVADVPVGVLLSGGLDSSLLVALLSKLGHQDIRSFAIGFEAVGEHSGDEFHYSDIVAKTFATDHRQIRIPRERALDALPGAIAAMSEPMVSHDAVAFYLLSAEVSKHVKVVQSGQGADEVFGGYSWYPGFLAANDPVHEYQRAYFDWRHSDLQRLLAPDLIGEDKSLQFVERFFAARDGASAIDKVLQIDAEIMMIDDPVKRVDNMTMDWGLEARVPFLDHELVELAAACPPELKLADGGKGVLKALGRRIIPPEVIDRPKGYFPVPALTHLEGPYLDLVRDALYAPAAKERDLFRPEAVERLLADPNGRLTPLRGNELWQLALLEMWLQRHGITGPAA
jgi:asparagine synthase (glutamine-hydrolysing)